jgi:hypothetical protein
MTSQLYPSEPGNCIRLIWMALSELDDLVADDGTESSVLMLAAVNVKTAIQMPLPDSCRLIATDASRAASSFSTASGVSVA